MTVQALITRLPYSTEYDPAPIFEMSKRVDPRGLICISMPIHLENPNNGGKLVAALEEGVRDQGGKVVVPGLVLVSLVSWYRDRHIVANKSRRITNTWEPLAIFSRSKNYILNREAPAKVKKGFESRETAFDEDEYLTCIGDHWPVRNDRRDRRFLPETVVLNCAQLADLNPKDIILDPYGNLGVKDACAHFGWTYQDGGLPSDVRGAKQSKEEESHALDE